MSVVFQPLQELGPSDLSIVIQDNLGNPINPFEVLYTIVYCEPGNPHGIVMPPELRTPANPSVGNFYADLQIPQGWRLGVYQIKWRWKLTASDPYVSALQTFQLVKLALNTGRCLPVTGAFSGTKFQIL